MMCQRGLHDLRQPENVYARTSGKRQCRPCMLKVHRRRAKERRANDPAFRAAESARHREWAAENAEHLKAYQAAYYQANRERRDSHSRASYRRHRERRLAYGKAWRDSNRGRMRLLVRAWREAHPERHAEKERQRRALRAGAESDGHTRAEVWAVTDGRCHVCNAELDPKDWHEDHVVPLARGGSDLLENCRAACPPCNLRRGAKTLDEFQEARDG